LDRRFKLVSPFEPAGDQPDAIRQLVSGLKKGFRFQTVLGATGTGKTFVMAKVIEELQRPTLVMVHNKTLASQLYLEFREFFPENAVHYFVSYYDYYQPEAYIAKSDTYIAKDSSINEEIDRLRNSATRSLLSRNDVIIVASVSAIYGLGSPEIYKGIRVQLKKGQNINRRDLLNKFVNMQYTRNDLVLNRGNFSVQGEVITIFPGYEEYNAIRVEFFGDEIENIFEVDTLTGEFKDEFEEVTIFPAKHYVVTKDQVKKILPDIRKEMEAQIEFFKKAGKEVEAQRIRERTEYDLEMMEQMGYVQGIENYTKYTEGLKDGEAPATLLDYFPKGFLTFIDESHITIPQIGGMFNGNYSRKETLVQYGFRLPSSFENRPLKFEEFVNRIGQTVFVSATPSSYENENSQKIIDLVVRPTGLVDPKIEVRPSQNQVDDLISEIRKTIVKKQRVLVTALTKKLSESIAEYLKELGIKVQYIHSDVDTIERVEILRDLRFGKYDVLVGINLLREGLDLPEVSLVGILDADKEGFLRSRTSLIQTIGRSARNVDGRVIMYADKITKSMKDAIDETERRRERQEKYNRDNGITPQTIIKAIREMDASIEKQKKSSRKSVGDDLKTGRIPKDEIKKIIKDLESKMQLSAQNMDFETAAELRDKIEELENRL